MVVLHGSELCTDQKINRIAPFVRCAASRGGWLPGCISGLRCPLNRTPRSEVDDDVRKKRKRQYAHQTHLRVMSSVECQAGWRPSLRCWQRTTTRMTTTMRQRPGAPPFHQRMAARSGNTCIDSLETIRHVPMLLSQVVGVGLFWACSYPRGCSLRIRAVNKSLSTAVWPIFDEMSVMEDVRRGVGV